MPSASFDALRQTRATYQNAEHEKLRTLLENARLNAGLSKRALSIKLGKQPTFIARVERGERLLEVVEFLEICRALAVSPNRVIDQLLEAQAQH